MLSIVVPVFNEHEGIREFYERTKMVLDRLDSIEYEVIFVDDGSTDTTYQELTRLSDNDARVRGIKLSRNFGHQVAITAGIDEAEGDAVVVIDADLQEPPEVIEQFVRKWEEGYDVVYGIRDERKGDTRLKRLTASMFYRILRALAQIDLPVDTGDFRLISRRVVIQLRQFKERSRFIRGLVSWIGFRQVGVHYKRDGRHAGKTKYPYRRMMRLALDGVTSFSTAPLKLATWLGYFSSLLAFLYLTSVFVQKAVGITVQGWATIMVGLLFLGGVQLICIGIMGEYVGRIFDELKQRPIYIVEEEYPSSRVSSGGEQAVSSALGQGRPARGRRTMESPPIAEVTRIDETAI
jgi:dolichol-phosphate mannosyltransferase